MKKRVLVIALIGLLAFLSPCFAHQEYTWSTSFDDGTGIAVETGSFTTGTVLNWGLGLDDANNKKLLKNTGDPTGIVVHSSLLPYSTYQRAQVLFKLTAAITDHITITVQGLFEDFAGSIDYTAYHSFIGKDTRCDGTGLGTFLAIEKGHKKSDGTYEDTLNDCQSIAGILTTNDVFLNRVTTEFKDGSSMKVTAELFKVTGTDTLVRQAISNMTDTYGDADGDPRPGNLSAIVVATDTQQMYFDKWNVISGTFRDPFVETNVQKFNTAGIAATKVGYAFGEIYNDYLYAAPCYNSGYTGTHGNAVRYHLRKDMTASASWESYDMTGIGGGCTNCTGYHGVAQYGGYMFYAPLWLANMSGTSGHAARYNVTGAGACTANTFTDADCWATYDITGEDAKAKGYVGVVSDGKGYLYYVPYGINQAIGLWAANTSYSVGNKVRPWTGNGFEYECTTAGTSHATTEPTWGTTEGGTTAEGPDTLVWTARQYFHGMVARHTSAADFTDGTKWDVYDLKAIDPKYTGFHLGCFDGRYVYLAPFANYYDEIFYHWEPGTSYSIGNKVFNSAGRNAYWYLCTDAGTSGGSPPTWNTTEGGETTDNDVKWRTMKANHGYVLRYDTNDTFADSGSWLRYDLLEKDPKAAGFYGCTVAGDYVYFPSNITGMVARYHRQTYATGAGGSNGWGAETTFTDAANWEVYDLYANRPSGAKAGWAGLTYYEGYVYLAPDYHVDTDDLNVHGWAARHKVSSAINADWQWLELTGVDSNLKGFHGAVSHHGAVFFIPVHSQTYPSQTAHGYFGKHNLKWDAGIQ